ncbi:MAG: hypothetical protein HC907_10070 [Richelia sp. SM1_7_0]|nr:hypothetical protein [Richelia sp. SM1_7_0]
MNFSKLTRKLTLLILPVAISSSVMLPTSVYAQINPLKRFSNKEVLKEITNTICANYATNRPKYGGCMALIVTSVLTANKLNISADGVNFQNKSQLSNFVSQTMRTLNTDKAFRSLFLSSDLTIEEKADILYKSILYYAMLKKADFY